MLKSTVENVKKVYSGGERKLEKNEVKNRNWAGAYEKETLKKTCSKTTFKLCLFIT